MDAKPIQTESPPAHHIPRPEGCGRLAGTEDRDALRAHHVGDAGDQGSLRPDHDELDPVVGRVLRDQLAVRGVEADGLDARLGRYSRVTGCDDELVAGILAQQCHDDRVLPGARAEDEDSHPPRLPAVT